MDPRVEWRRRPPQSLEAHGGGADSGPPQHFCVVHQQGQQRGLGLGAVDERDAFLGAELPGLDACRRERGPGRPALAIRGQYLALAHHHHGHVRQRSEITARTHTALLRHPGQDPRIEETNQRGHQPRPDPAGGPSQYVGAEQHERTHGLGGKRRSHTGRMAPHQVYLQLLQVGRIDPHVGELAEPGVDAVHRPPGGYRRINQCPAGLKRALSRRSERDLHSGIARGSYHVLDGERVAVDCQLGHARNYRHRGQVKSDR